MAVHSTRDAKSGCDASASADVRSHLIGAAYGGLALEDRISGVVGLRGIGPRCRAGIDGPIRERRRAGRAQPLACFFSFFAARFSSRVLVGFFFSSFFRSIPLPMIHSSFDQPFSVNSSLYAGSAFFAPYAGRTNPWAAWAASRSPG